MPKWMTKRGPCLYCKTRTTHVVKLKWLNHKPVLKFLCLDCETREIKRGNIF
jgi:uncharacterized protein YlaI